MMEEEVKEPVGEFELSRLETRLLPSLSLVRFTYLENPKIVHFEKASDFVQTFINEFDNFKMQELTY